MSGPTLTSNTIYPERGATPAEAANGLSHTQRKLERMQSRARRDHSHQHSHSSRHHKDEQKTVGEYALHVLFTSVCFAQLLSKRLPADFYLVYCPSRGETQPVLQRTI